MAGGSQTITEYIQHHLTNLTYGQLPAGTVRDDGTVLTESVWTMAHGGQEAAAMPGLPDRRLPVRAAGH